MGLQVVGSDTGIYYDVYTVLLGIKLRTRLEAQASSDLPWYACEHKYPIACNTCTAWHNLVLPFLHLKDAQKGKKFIWLFAFFLLIAHARAQFYYKNCVLTEQIVFDIIVIGGSVAFFATPKNRRGKWKRKTLLF